ncbi:hypothetical protein BAE44_0016029, partial [Dichanthelium oligosanthes]
DKRLYALFGVPVSSLILAILLRSHVNWIGWLGFSLTVFSLLPVQSYRLGIQSSFIVCGMYPNSNYRDDFTFWVFGASIPIWLVNALISAVGAVTGFLWLRHPQLCLSLEYKVRMVK